MLELQNVFNLAQASGHWNIKITSVESRSAFNETPIHLFCRLGNYNAVQILLEAGANVNVEGEKLATPLSYAIAFEHFEIVELLLKYSASRNINLFGVKQDALEYSISKYEYSKSLGSQKIVKLLQNPKPKKIRFLKNISSSNAIKKKNKSKNLLTKNCQIKTGEIFKEIPQAPQMVVLPKGSFLMGTSDQSYFEHTLKLAPHTSNVNHLMAMGYYWVLDQCPQHKVQISYDLAMGIYPVTFEEWDACVADRGTNYQPNDNGWGRGKRPVINVSWSDAIIYLSWLNKYLGIDEHDPSKYRLPSEAEWEYACRAGTMGYFSTPSGEITDSQACYDASNVIEGLSSVAGKKHDRTTTVGMYAPNAWGLYDMHGNVDEIVEGSYESNYLQAPDNGAILATGSDSWVVRGGSWFSSAIDMYSAARTKVSIPGNRNIYTGFRVVRTVKNS